MEWIFWAHSLAKAKRKRWKIIKNKIAIVRDIEILQFFFTDNVCIILKNLLDCCERKGFIELIQKSTSGLCNTSVLLCKIRQHNVVMKIYTINYIWLESLFRISRNKFSFSYILISIINKKLTNCKYIFFLFFFCFFFVLFTHRREILYYLFSRFLYKLFLHIFFIPNKLANIWMNCYWIKFFFLFYKMVHNTTIIMFHYYIINLRTFYI